VYCFGRLVANSARTCADACTDDVWNACGPVCNDGYACADDIGIDHFDDNAASRGAFVHGIDDGHGTGALIYGNSSQSTGASAASRWLNGSRPPRIHGQPACW